MCKAGQTTKHDASDYLSRQTNYFRSAGTDCSTSAVDAIGKIFYLVVDRDEGVFASLGKSREMVRQAGFANCFLLTVIDVVLHLAPTAIPYVGWVFGWFITPIGWLIVASAYAQIIESQKLPLSDEEVFGR
jgi:hypothetical protein